MNTKVRMIDGGRIGFIYHISPDEIKPNTVYRVRLQQSLNHSYAPHSINSKNFEVIPTPEITPEKIASFLERFNKRKIN